MAFSHTINKLKSGSVHYRLLKDKLTITYATFLRLLRSDKAFRDHFIHLLSDIPFKAYQWETPPVNPSTLTRQFEFVLTNNPGIDMRPDPRPFQSYFTTGHNGLGLADGDDDRESQKDVAVFKNLGGDATLVAPVPVTESASVRPVSDSSPQTSSISKAKASSHPKHSPHKNYSHIGVFTQYAPRRLQHNFWKTVGQTMEQNLSQTEQTIWLNTAGGGVAWLHVRLDTRPKYYQYQPYKTRP